jgi:hypothetical protein
MNTTVRTTNTATRTYADVGNRSSFTVPDGTA